jgi:hypothetical protein
MEKKMSNVKSALAWKMISFLGLPVLILCVWLVFSPYVALRLLGMILLTVYFLLLQEIALRFLYPLPAPLTAEDLLEEGKVRIESLKDGDLLILSDGSLEVEEFEKFVKEMRDRARKVNFPNFMILQADIKKLSIHDGDIFQVSNEFDRQELENFANEVRKRGIEGVLFIHGELEKVSGEELQQAGLQRIK